MEKALIIGLGKSGKAAALLLQSEGCMCFGFDDGPGEGPFEDMCVLTKEKAAQELGKGFFSLVIISPGVSSCHPLYEMARAQGIRCLGEAALGLQRLNQTCIGITGTNGKTTVTALVTHVLEANGIPARSLGNIGHPLCEYALHANEKEILVIELSSYQLETIEGAVLDQAALLNITPDHLDRHASMEEYAAAKWRIQGALKKDGELIVHQSVLRDWGFLKQVPNSISYDEAMEREGEAVRSVFASFEEKGHDLENVLVSFLLVRHFGVTPVGFATALRTFKKPAHRVEFVARIDGVSYFDDSKGTNIDATKKAVESMKGPVYLIAGGVDKGASYAYWEETFKGKVRVIFALGAARDKIAREAGAFCRVIKVETLEKAVREASLVAEEGSQILLSPGCSSFDMFSSYAHRGEVFQSCVRMLEKRPLTTPKERRQNSS